MPEYHLSVVGLPGHCRLNFWPSFELQAIQCMNAQRGGNGAAEQSRDTEEMGDTVCPPWAVPNAPAAASCAQSEKTDMQQK